MKKTHRFLGAMTAIMIAASTNAQSAASPTAAVTIVLVHGALIDGSSWRGVYDVLTRDGSTLSQMVTGPSLVRLTCMYAPKRPVSTTGYHARARATK